MKSVSSYRDTRETARGPDRGRARSASPDASLGERRRVADEKPRPEAVEAAEAAAPPLPDNEEPPPLPEEPAPEDDGWDYKIDPASGHFFFYNRLTGVSQWENPRVSPEAAAASYGSYDRFANISQSTSNFFNPNLCPG